MGNLVRFFMACHPGKSIKKNVKKAIKNPLIGSLPKSGPLDFAIKNTSPLFFVGEEALVGIY